MESMTSPWTGRTACALQKALPLSNEAFAKHLGIAVRTVAAWHEYPDRIPRSEIQQLLDRALEQASPSAKARFAELVGQTPAPTLKSEAAADIEWRLSVDPHMKAALEWLDWRAEWEPGTGRYEVAKLLDELDVRKLHDRNARRARIHRQLVVNALGEYYGNSAAGYGRYVGRYGDHRAETSILTCPDWLDLGTPLVPDHDRFTLRSGVIDGGPSLNQSTATHAVRRLAETLTLGTRLVDMPLYRLLDLDIHSGQLAGTLGLTRFAQYALTMDLLEGELIDAVVAGVTPRHGALPLRDSYLPDLGSVIDVSSRLCCGGALALCAIARPATFERAQADYLILVQERSSQVINATGQLAVIPKAFHQPTTDVRADTQIGTTLRREMEEELFGREDDIDNTLYDQRSADPMHPSRLSEPMRWLMEAPGRLKMESTAFGLNLVSGNFECASLVVIDDDEFWLRFGGQIEANWESSSLRRYSSLDQDLLTELLAEPGWSNEGLFAFMQALRRLGQLDSPRTNMPTIDWELT